MDTTTNGDFHPTKTALKKGALGGVSSASSFAGARTPNSREKSAEIENISIALQFGERQAQVASAKGGSNSPSAWNVKTDINLLSLKFYYVAAKFGGYLYIEQTSLYCVPGKGQYAASKVFAI